MILGVLIPLYYRGHYFFKSSDFFGALGMAHMRVMKFRTEGRSRRQSVEDKGIHRDVETEGSPKQNSDLWSTNH